MKNDFLRLLRPLRRKLATERFCKRLLYLETAAALLSTILVICSKWIAIRYVWLYCIGLFALGFCVAWFWSFVLRRVTPKEIMETADALGAKERMVTTWELLERTPQNEVERLAVEDGMEMAKHENFAKQYHMQLPKKVAIVGLCMLLLLVAAGFVPVQREQEVALYAQIQLDKIEQIKEEVKEDMTKEEQKQFEEVVSSLEWELKQAKTEAEAKQAIQEAQQEMKQLQKESVSEDLKNLADALQTQESTAPAGQTLAQGNTGASEQAMQQLANALQNMTDAQKQQLAAQLQQAMEGMTSQEMQQAMQDLQNALENGTDPSDALEQLGNAASQQAQQNAGLRNGLQKMNEGVGQSSGQGTSGQSQSGAQNGEAQQTQNNGENGENGQNGQNGQSGQNGQNGQNGQSGNGSQGGSGGTGAGLGNQPGGDGRGSGHVDAEEIYTRGAADKGGYDAELGGTDSGEGQTTTTEGTTTGQRGESVPYEQVYQEYRDEAIRQMDNSDVPYGMRELVSDYFSTLER